MASARHVYDFINVWELQHKILQAGAEAGAVQCGRDGRNLWFKQLKMTKNPQPHQCPNHWTLMLWGENRRLCSFSARRRLLVLTRSVIRKYTTNRLRNFPSPPPYLSHPACLKVAQVQNFKVKPEDLKDAVLVRWQAHPHMLSLLWALFCSQTDILISYDLVKTNIACLMLMIGGGGCTWYIIVSHHNHTSNHLTTMELSNNNQTCYFALIKTLQSEKVRRREKLSDSPILVSTTPEWLHCQYCWFSTHYTGNQSVKKAWSKN